MILWLFRCTIFSVSFRFRFALVLPNSGHVSPTISFYLVWYRLGFTRCVRVTTYSCALIRVVGVYFRCILLAINSHNGHNRVTCKRLIL